MRWLGVAETWCFLPTHACDQQNLNCLSAPMVNIGDQFPSLRNPELHYTIKAVSSRETRGSITPSQQFHETPSGTVSQSSYSSFESCSNGVVPDHFQGYSPYLLFPHGKQSWDLWVYIFFSQNLPCLCHEDTWCSGASKVSTSSICITVVTLREPCFLPQALGRKSNYAGSEWESEEEKSIKLLGWAGRERRL